MKVILTSNDKVKAILVNIFGGIMKCDVIAKEEVTKSAEQDTNKVEGDAKLKDQGIGTSEKKEAAPNT
ncbi:hypothetical protein CRYUN_Cryun34aG0033500 [Craigia yunnanensis]